MQGDTSLLDRLRVEPRQYASGPAILDSIVKVWGGASRRFFRMWPWLTLTYKTAPAVVAFSPCMCVCVCSQFRTKLLPPPSPSTPAQVFAVSSKPNHFLPWQNHPKREGTGTGFVAHDRLILTNAHVVADSTYVLVKRHGSGTKYRAGG